MYKALTDFIDLQDNYRKYRAGDTFPRTGYDPGEERIAELAGTNNKRGCAVIVKVAEKAAEKPKKEEVEILTESVTEPEKGKEKAQKASAAKPKRKGRPKKE